MHRCISLNYCYTQTNTFELLFALMCFRNTVLVNRRATFARETNGFGAWRDIFSFVSLLGIFINCIIIYHTSNRGFDIYGFYRILSPSTTCEESSDDIKSYSNSTQTFLNQYSKCSNQLNLCERLVCIDEQYHSKLMSVLLVLLLCLFIKWFLQLTIDDVPSWIIKDLSASTLDHLLEIEAENADNTGVSSVTQQQNQDTRKWKQVAQQQNSERNMVAKWKHLEAGGKFAGPSKNVESK